MKSSRTALTLAVLSSLMLNLGCAAIWHELQPHRMNRLNRVPAPSFDPEFSLKQRGTQNRLAKQEAKQPDATIQANTPTFADIRAQSP